MRALLYAIRAVGGRDACGRKRGGGGVLVPGQRRLAFTSSKIPKKIEEEKKKKKTYKLECPDNVDLQSPDCESQILAVLSKLPLAICFPSGLHATDMTL